MSERRKKLFKNWTDYLVAAFVILGVGAMLAFCEDSNAQAASPGWAVEYTHDSNAGSTTFNAGLDRICLKYTFEGFTAMDFCPLVGIGGNIKRDSFELGLTEELFPRWEGRIFLNRVDGFMDGGATIRRVIGDGPFQTSLGLTRWINQSPGSNSDITFNLGMRYSF